MKLLTADPPPYVYRVKGRYWYFRCGDLSARIDAELGTDAFGARYEELLRLSQRGDAPPTPQPRRAATQARWQVYFLGWDDGPIKIGIALDPATRLYQAQTYSPYKLELWATCLGGQVAERIYHKRFADRRLNGEWFERCPEIEAEIARLNGDAPNSNGPSPEGFVR